MILSPPTAPQPVAPLVQQIALRPLQPTMVGPQVQLITPEIKMIGPPGPPGPPGSGAAGAVTGVNLTSPTLGVLDDAEIVTSLGHAASAGSITGQGALATLSELAFGDAYLTGFGELAALSELALGGGYLSGFGALAALGYVTTGASGQVYSAAYGFLADLEIYTAIGQAATIAGQGSLATLSELAYGDAYLTGFGELAALSELALGGGYLTGFGELAALGYVTTGSSGQLYSAAYGFLADTEIYTAVGQAATIYGQSSWATFAEFGTNVLTAPFGNIVYNGTFTLDTAGWSSAGAAGPYAAVDGAGAWGYLQTTGAPGYYATVNSQSVVIDLGTTIYISASIGLVGEAGDFAYLSVIWKDPATGTAVTSSGFVATGAGPWQSVTGTAAAPTTDVPAAGYWLASLQCVIYKASPTGTYTTGYFRNIMASVAGYFPFTDTLTSGALSTGIFSAAYGLQAETNILTSLGQAATFSGQGALATLSSLTLGSAELIGFGSLAGLSSLALGSGYLTGFGSLAELNVVETGPSGQIYSATYGFFSDISIYTPIGQAATISGQGALATLSALALGAAELTGFGELAALDLVDTLEVASGAVIQGHIYENDSATSYGNAGTTGITLGSWSIAFTGTPLLINLLVQSTNHSTNHYQYMRFYIEVDGTQIASSVFPNTLDENSQSLTAGQPSQATSFFEYQPSAGTHTISIVADHLSGTDNESSATIARMYILELRNQY